MTPCDDGMFCPTVRTSYIYIYICTLNRSRISQNWVSPMNEHETTIESNHLCACCSLQNICCALLQFQKQDKGMMGEKDNSITTFWKVAYLVFLKENRLSAFSRVTSISPKHGHLRPKSCDLFGPRSFWLTVCWLDLPKKSQNHKVAHRLAPFQGNYKLCSIHFHRLIVSPKPDPYPKCCCPQMHKTICIPRFVAVNA